jgi:hypothetical protein
MVATIFVGGVIGIWNDSAATTVISLALLGLPVFTGVAIVRNRLYDIDLILINRALVHGALTALLVAVYFGGVARHRLSSAPSQAKRSNPSWPSLSPP